MMGRSRPKDTPPRLRSDVMPDRRGSEPARYDGWAALEKALERIKRYAVHNYVYVLGIQAAVKDAEAAVGEAKRRESELRQDAKMLLAERDAAGAKYMAGRARAAELESKAAMWEAEYREEHRRYREAEARAAELERENAWLHGIIYEHVGTDAPNVDPEGWEALEARREAGEQ